VSGILEIGSIEIGDNSVHVSDGKETLELDLTDGCELNDGRDVDDELAVATLAGEDSWHVELLRFASRLRVLAPHRRLTPGYVSRICSLGTASGIASDDDWRAFATRSNTTPKIAREVSVPVTTRPPADLLRWIAGNEDPDVRQLLADCRYLPDDVVASLISDENADVRAAAAWHTTMTVDDLRSLRGDGDPRIRLASVVRLAARERSDVAKDEIVALLQAGGGRGAGLWGTNLRDVALDGVDLQSASLDNGVLDGASLREANLRFANLRAASLVGVDASGADISQADLRFCDLSESDLEGARLELSWALRASFSKANLADARVGGAMLKYADLTGADLRRVDFEWTYTSGACLRSARLEGSVLTSNHSGPIEALTTAPPDPDRGTGPPVSREEATALESRDSTGRDCTSDSSWGFGSMGETFGGLDSTVPTWREPRSSVPTCATRAFGAPSSVTRRSRSPRHAAPSISITNGTTSPAWQPSSTASIWRALTCVPMAGCSLRRGSLVGCDLEGADLSRACLAEADPREARLTDSENRFEPITLAGSVLAAANLDGAVTCGARMGGGMNWTDVTLLGARVRLFGLWESVLSGVDFTGATLGFMELRGCDLRGARFNDVTCMSNEYRLLTKCDLRGVDLTPIPDAIVEDCLT
jgi:uncharacterized protein YjbI with pentapeptide repeats